MQRPRLEAAPVMRTMWVLEVAMMMLLLCVVERGEGKVRRLKETENRWDGMIYVPRSKAVRGPGCTSAIDGRTTTRYTVRLHRRPTASTDRRGEGACGGERRKAVSRASERVELRRARAEADDVDATDLREVYRSELLSLSGLQPLNNF